MKPVIFGMTGEKLTEEERAFFKEADPAGYILFARNIVSKEQVRALTDELRGLQGRDDLAILIDQEGGRVARMREPVWPQFPAGGVFDALYETAPASAIEAARVNAQAIATILAEVGITVNCLPLLDVRQPDADPVMGDRTLGMDPMRVAAIGRAILDGLIAGGVMGVVKHMPGHGRATVDSHKELPVVRSSDADLQHDLAPFAALKDAPMGMTAHVVYTAWDKEKPASVSPYIIQNIIRERIGFDGLLMSDDLDMSALMGGVPDRAVDVVAAGCDIALNCWGRMPEMVEMAERLPDIRPEARERLDRAMSMITTKKRELPPFAELVAKRDALLAVA